jgi:hypothetical protein
MLFSDLSYYLFQEFQIILFALNVYVPEYSTQHVTLNPGSKYELKEGDSCVFIAHSRKDVEGACDLTLLAHMDSLENTHENPVPLKPQSSEKIITHIYKADYYTCDESVHSPCVLLNDNPVLMSTKMIIENTIGIRGFVLLCTSAYNVVRFVRTLRSSHLIPSELKPVVIMCKNPPIEKELQSLSQYPLVYIIVGDPEKSSDLKKAGLLNADKIVLLNLSHEKEDCPNDETLVDISTIMASNLIYKICEEAGVRKHIVTDLMKQSNIRFLAVSIKLIKSLKKEKLRKKCLISHADLKKSEKSIGSDIYYSSIFASGRVLTSMMLEALLASAFQQPYLVDIFNLLLGVRYKVFNYIN